MLRRDPMPDPHSLATETAPLCQGPDPEPRGPRRFRVPAGAVDTHAHVIGLPPDYPFVANRSYTPLPAPPEEYFAMLDGSGMAHGVLVQVSVHGTDNRLMLETLRRQSVRLRGICVVDADVSDHALEEMAAAGVVGCRFNVLYGGGVGLDAMETLARRVAPLKWHTQLLLDARSLPELAPRLRRLPVPFVIDHMGHMPASVGVSHPGFQTLLALMKDAPCWVKLSGAYRQSVQGPPYADTIPFARALIAAHPDRLVWGSDWPHVALQGPMPNVGDLLDLLADWAPDADTRKRILVHNAHRLYGFRP
jgi:2-pyrone-4,6-dicarboxylate lactonase